jgi:tetratricopeptide (TPR) repeat protein
MRKHAGRRKRSLMRGRRDFFIIPLRHFSMRWLLATAAVALVASIWLIRMRRAEPMPSPPISDYVNPALCANCHQKIARSYGLTGMGRSFSRPRAENIVEDYQARNTLYHRASDRYYTMIARDGRWFQRRHQIGFDSGETNIVEMSIDYAIGSGNHARSYLHRTGEGKLVELPVTWYSENNGAWAMSPGYDRPDQSDFRRAISFECMSCHNGYPSSVGGTDLIFGADIPEGIDCQRCHGPGRAHMEAASSGHATPDSIRRAIVNPARLNRERQLDVCGQCHLQTTSLRSPDSIRRYNRRPFSFRPGEALTDYEVLFDYADPVHADTFEIDHAAYRLQKSKCFERSQMTCTTCHDPHQATQHYEEICRNCHNSAHSGAIAKGCIDCHMPKRRTEDVVHAVMTDHYIQRRRPEKDLLAPREEIHQAGRYDVAIYRPSQLSASDAELYLGVAEAQQRTDPKSGIAKLEAAIERYHPAEPEFYFELGRAYVKSGEVDKGAHWLEEALRIRRDFPPALKELGAALSESGQLSRAAEILERANNFRDAEALTDLGGVYLRQDRLDEAQKVLHTAIEINPDLPAAHNLLGLALLRKGELRGADSEFREGIRMQPDFSEAQSNLGNLLAGEGDLKQAIFHFKKAIAGDPENVDAHSNLGQALAASGSLRDALTEMQTSARLNPKSGKLQCDLGRLLTMLGRTEEAQRHYLQAVEAEPNVAEFHYYAGQSLASQRKLNEAEQQFRLAIQLSPDFYAAHFALGQILAGRGNVGEAETHFEKATHSPDPELRKAADAERNSMRRQPQR